MSWPLRKESFKRGTAEQQPQISLKDEGAEFPIRGIVDTPEIVTTDLHITNLPDNGPWLVMVNGTVDNGEAIRIREGDISGVIKGWLESYAGGSVYASGSAIIYGNEFYVELYGWAVRYSVTWEKFVDNDIYSTRTAI